MDDLDDLIEDDVPPEEDGMLPPDGWEDEPPRTGAHQTQHHAGTPMPQSRGSAGSDTGLQGPSQATSQASAQPPRLCNPPAFSQPQFSTPIANQVITYKPELCRVCNELRLARPECPVVLHTTLLSVADSNADSCASPGFAIDAR